MLDAGVFGRWHISDLDCTGPYVGAGCACSSCGGAIRCRADSAGARECSPKYPCRGIRGLESHPYASADLAEWQRRIAAVKLAETDGMFCRLVQREKIAWVMLDPDPDGSGMHCW